MIDGLSTENVNVGTVTASTALSGADLLVASATIDATELAASSVGTSEISTAVYQAGSNTLATNLKWVAFGTAMPDTNYHVGVTEKGGTTDAVERWSTGSYTVGSFLVMGSPTATSSFDWIAIARK